MRQNNSNVILARVHTSLQILFIREKKEETHFTYPRSLKGTSKTGNMGRKKKQPVLSFKKFAAISKQSVG